MGVVPALGRVSANIENATRANEFIQVARYLALGGQGGGFVDRNALAMAQADRASPRVVDGIKAAVAAGQLGVSGYASELAEFNTLAAGFLESLRHNSAFQFILSDGGFRQVPLRTRLGTVTVGAVSSQVAEGARKPVTQLSLASGGVLDPTKAVCIVALTAELARMGGAIANNLIGAELRAAVAVETDTLVFAELLALSSSPGQASAGTTGANALTDVAFMLNNVTTSSRSRLYFVGAPDAVKKFSTRSNAGVLTFPQLGPNGGSMLGVTTLVSDGIPAGQMLLMDAAQIAAADDGITLSSSSQATLALDTAPTAGTALHSLFQENLVAIKAERYFAVQALTGTALSYITGIA